MEEFCEFISVSDVSHSRLLSLKVLIQLNVVTPLPSGLWVGHGALPTRPEERHAPPSPPEGCCSPAGKRDFTALASLLCTGSLDIEFTLKAAYNYGCYFFKCNHVIKPGKTFKKKETGCTCLSCRGFEPCVKAWFDSAVEGEKAPGREGGGQGAPTANSWRQECLSLRGGTFQVLPYGDPAGSHTQDLVLLGWWSRCCGLRESAAASRSRGCSCLTGV